MGRVVLVTGVSRALGGHFARRIAAEPSVDRVIGVDVVPPRQNLAGLGNHGVLGDSGDPVDPVDIAFVRADIRNPVIAKVIAGQAVDTVVHLSVQSSPSEPGRAGGRTSMKEHNVIGTMQLLAACQKAPGLERLVVRSSGAVYGSSSRDPAMFTEDMSAKQMPRSGYGKDVLEVEGYVRGFARRRPDVAVTTLRAASVVGPTVTSRLTEYFRLPVVPTVLGFDARLQFLHEDDLLGVLLHATLGGVHGTFNVAGEGMLVLSQALRRLGRPSVPVPTFAVGPVTALARKAGVPGLPPELAQYLTFGRGLDTSRMRTLLGFSPAYTSAEALADFGRTLVPSPLPQPLTALATASTAGGTDG